MQIPNKLYSFNDSCFRLLASIIKELDTPKEPRELFLSIQNAGANITDFIDSLDCLFALRVIEFTDDGRRLFIC